MRPLLLIALLSLTACAGALDKLSRAGQPPVLSAIQDPRSAPTYRPVSLPMPEQKPVVRTANSLWATGSRSFFKDQRATEVGDIVTVVIDVDDEAQLNNQSTRSRDSKEGLGVGSLLGFETNFDKWLPGAPQAAGKLYDINSSSDNKGSGKIDRKEQVKLKVAALVTQKLPNGNLVVHGRQEVGVNAEVRDLQVAGIVRPADITADNTIALEKIAEARVGYGGRGQVSDVQQPRYGSEVMDIILPF